MLEKRNGAQLPKIEVDGLVVGARFVLLNSVKHTPTLAHVTEAVTAAETLQALLAASLERVTTDPSGLEGELAKIAERTVLPFLSGNNVSADVIAECRKMGVGCVRPDDSGFAVVALPNKAAAQAARAAAQAAASFVTPSAASPLLRIRGGRGRGAAGRGA